jgi:hypothetical protein
LISSRSTAGSRPNRTVVVPTSIMPPLPHSRPSPAIYISKPAFSPHFQTGANKPCHFAHRPQCARCDIGGVFIGDWNPNQAGLRALAFSRIRRDGQPNSTKRRSNCALTIPSRMFALDQKRNARSHAVMGRMMPQTLRHCQLSTANSILSPPGLTRREVIPHNSNGSYGPLYESRRSLFKTDN